MGLACKITGHKWNGCVCARCGERRDTGVAKDHNYVVVPGTTCEYECTKCGKRTMGHNWYYHWSCTCETCGATREVEDRFHDWDGCTCKLCGKKNPKAREDDHDWDGCTCKKCGATRGKFHKWEGCMCARCGTVRSEGHILKRVQPDGNNETKHKGTCQICKCTSYEPHTFEQIEGCRRKCTKCGFVMPWHEFCGGACVNCGTDESDYSCELILAGKARYMGKGSVGGHVTSVAALRRIALSDNKNIYRDIRYDCARRLRDIAKAGGSDAHEANVTLRDIVLDRKIGWDVADVAEWITEPTLANDPKVIEIVRQAQRSRTDFDNAMIAADSGLGRSG